MDNAHLPIDICEHIIDFMGDPDLDAMWNIPVSFAKLGYPSRPRSNLDHKWWTDMAQHCLVYRMCALTCSAWLHRSRYNLYRTVAITTHAQANIFLHTIACHAFLADLARTLVLPWQTTYIPVAALIKPLRNLQCLTYRPADGGYFGMVTRIARAYPPKYHILIAQFPIVELSFIGLWTTFRPHLIEVFRLIWSSCKIKYLTCAFFQDFGVLSHPQSSGLSADELEKLRVLCRRNACANLTTLVLMGNVYHDMYRELPGHAFGHSVTTFTVHIPSNQSAVFQLPSFSNLEELILWVSHIPPLSVPDESGIHMVLDHLHPNTEGTLRRILIVIDLSERDINLADPATMLQNLFSTQLSRRIVKFTAVQSFQVHVMLRETYFHVDTPAQWWGDSLSLFEWPTLEISVEALPSH